MSKKDTSSETDPIAPPISFETAMSELEQLVARMESGELTLDDSLQAFERGIALTRQCQEALSQAELRVQTLTAQGTLEPFKPSGS